MWINENLMSIYPVQSEGWSYLKLFQELYISKKKNFPRLLKNYIIYEMCRDDKGLPTI